MCLLIIEDYANWIRTYNLQLSVCSIIFYIMSISQSINVSIIPFSLVDSLAKIFIVIKLVDNILQ